MPVFLFPHNNIDTDTEYRQIFFFFYWALKLLLLLTEALPGGGEIHDLKHSFYKTADFISFNSTRTHHLALQK